MRSRLIQVTGVGMKPNTRVFAYFDNELVSDFVTPANSSFANTAAEGSTLTTDSSGTVHANFRLPNTDTLKFRIGTKRFEFKDVANTITQSSLITTSAFGDYTSIPLNITQRGASVNLVQPQIQTNQVQDTRTLTSSITVQPPEDNPPPEQTGRGNDSYVSDVHCRHRSRWRVFSQLKLVSSLVKSQAHISNHTSAS